MLYCSNCGSQIPEGGRFCPVCGMRAPEAPACEPAPEEAVPYTEEVPAADEAAYPEETAYAGEADYSQDAAYAGEADYSQDAPYAGDGFYAEDAPAAGEAPAGSWYQSAEQPQYAPPVEPVYVPTKPSIGGIFDFYRKAFAVLAQKPIKLWGLSLLYLFIAGVISSLGSLVPIITVPIVLLLGLGFTGVLLDGYHGKDVRSEQLFQAFKKDEVVRNGAGMCWMELWTLIWAFVPIMNIIKSYAYSFVPYILLTDKEITATEALRKSMRMTDGYKGKMFGADILLVLGFFVSFIVLVLLARIPYVGFIFGILCFLLYVAFILFAPIFMGLVRTSIFEAVSAVHEE